MKVLSVSNYGLHVPNFQNKNISFKNQNSLQNSDCTNSIPSFEQYQQTIFKLDKEGIEYKTNLASALSKELGKEIPISNLQSVMTKQEILSELPKLQKQNFIASEKNAQRGIFLADLHSHSKYSDGQSTVQTILDDAAAYGDKLNAKNGKKFIFALTDHDKIDGVKEALKIIVQNPDKYKNIKFIPAAELSFIIPCERDSDRYNLHKRQGLITRSEYPEALIYGINPFSNNTQKFFENVYARRIQKVDDVFEKVHQKLSSEYPFSESSFKYLKEYPQYFTQNKQIAKHLKYNLAEGISRIYAQINEDYLYPKFFNMDEVNSKYEKSFKEIVNYAKKENAIIALAHPAYTVQNFKNENMLKNMQWLVNASDGTLKFAERYHQAYLIGPDYDIVSNEALDKYNKVIDKLNLIGIGGQDNHQPHLFKFNPKAL